MNDFLKNLFNFNKTDTNVIGIDIGSSSIKVVQLAKSKGKAILKTYGSLALGPYAGVTIGQAANLPAEKLSEVIIDLLKEANVNTTNAGVAIPLRSSLVSLIEMPNLPQSELQKMVPLEARKYIPVPISEVTMDWWVIPKEEERTFASPESAPMLKSDKAEVLVVSIHNEVLSNYTNVIKNAGLSTSFFEIEMFATIRSLVQHELSPVVIFDMGAAATKLYLVERGVVKQSHIINKGSQDITIAISQGLQVSMDKAEKMKRSIGTLSKEEAQNVFNICELTLDYIFSEAGSVLLSFEKKNHKAVSRVYLTGGGILMKGFVDLAKSKFQTDVIVGDPFSKIEVPAFLSEILKESGLDFAVATGIALRKLQEFL